MRFSITGVNHKSAPVEVRERLAFDENSLSAALLDLKSRPGFCEGMILSTCNRVEIALTCEDGPASGVAVDEFLADTRKVARDWVTPYLYRYEDSEAILHLFRVAASLDSMVVGEPQILGQLKTAYALAKEHGAVSGFMDTLLTRAFSVAKRVRSETEIGANAVSVSYAAVELAREIFGSLKRQEGNDGGRRKNVGARGPPLAPQRRHTDLRHQPDARTGRRKWRGFSKPKWWTTRNSWASFPKWTS